MLGKHYLCAVVTQDAANWLTPQSGDVTGSTREAVVMWANGQRPKTSDQRLRTQVAAEELKHGQAAPASSSSLGSRQGLWATPAAFDWNTAESKAAWEKRAAEQKAKGVNLHLPLKSQAIHEAEKSWATPRTPTGGPETAKRKQELGRTANGGGDLASQANGRLNSQWVTQLMGLNLGWVSPSCPASVIKNWPRFVSGWSALTIAPMSCDSSAMELSQPPQSELSEFSLASWPSPRAGESQQTEELSRLWVENGFKQPKTRSGKARANGSTFDVTLETAARGVAAMERQQ
jgi:hypothetical protein